MKLNGQSVGYALIYLLGITFCIVLFIIGPINQSDIYHDFIDKEKCFGIQNFWNVVTNLPFLIVGCFGACFFAKTYRIDFQYLTFFIGILLVSFCSSYYHLVPNSRTLIWDRLPMTIAFMALVSVLVSEFLNNKLGRVMLLPLLVIGVLSILYWLVFNDLRLYVFVQFFPVGVLPILLILFKNNRNSVFGYWLLLLAYVMAKLFEYYDAEIYALIGFSGHAVKHILSAIGIYFLFRYYKN